MIRNSFLHSTPILIQKRTHTTLLDALEHHYGDLLPSCGVLELLDTSSPALDTLSNCLHSIATIRDQSRLLGINRD